MTQLSQIILFFVFALLFNANASIQNKDLLDLTTFDVQKTNQQIGKNISAIVDDLDKYQYNTKLLNKLIPQLTKNPIWHPYVSWAKSLKSIYRINSFGLYKKTCLKPFPDFELEFLGESLQKACKTIFYDKLLSKSEKNSGLLEQVEKDLISADTEALGLYLRKNTKHELSSTISNFIVKNSINPSQSILRQIEPNVQLTQYLNSTRYFDLSVGDRKLHELRSINTELRKFIKEESNDIDFLDRKVSEMVSISNKYIRQLNKVDAWANNMVMGKRLMNAGFSEHSRKLYLTCFNFADKEQWQRTVFQYLWTFLREKNHKGAYSAVQKFSLEERFDQLNTNIKFWMAYTLQKNDQEDKAKTFYQKIVKYDPLTYYAIVASKFLSKIKNNLTNTILVNKVDTDSKIIPLNKLNNNIINDLKRFMVWSRLNDLWFINKEIENMLKLNDYEFLASNYRKDSKMLQKIRPNLYTFYAKSLSSNGNYLRSFIVINKGVRNRFVTANNEILDILFPIPYKKLVKKYAKEIDPAIFLSLIRQESAFNPKARSHVGARGLMQLMPATAKQVQRKVSSRKLYNPKTNIRIGTKYFNRLLKKNNGNIAYTLMAYNAGEGNLRKWKNRIFTDDSLIHTIENIPFNETRQYVKLILRNLYFYKIKFEKEADTAKLTKIFDVDIGFK